MDSSVFLSLNIEDSEQQSSKEGLVQQDLWIIFSANVPLTSCQGLNPMSVGGLKQDTERCARRG
jgi:hypothetical protein